MYFKILFSFLLLLIFDHASGQINKNEISAYEFRDSSSFMGTNRVRVYHFGDLVMYEKENIIDSTAPDLLVDSLVAIDSTVITMSDTTVTTVDLLPADAVLFGSHTSYIVHHKDSSFGVTFYSVETPLNGRRNVLENLLHGVRQDNQLEQLLNKLPESSTWNKDKSVLLETYKYTQNPDTPNISIKMFYSSKQRDVKESLNPVIDSLKQLKLFRVELTIDSFYNKKNKITSPPIFLSLELRKIDVPDEKLIRSYFAKYNALIKPE